MIGILGGSFDPIHLGHLRTALELRDLFQLQELRMLPCGQPPHRSGPVASAQQRVAMLRLALAGEPGVLIDERELHRPGPSYTVDTLLSVRAELPGVTLCLVIGADQFVSLDTWHRWRELPELAHLIVVYRPGWSLTGQIANPELARWVQEQLTESVADLEHSPSGRLFFAQTSAMDIASSRIRALIAQGKSVRYLVPDAVADYIRDHHLYRTTEAVK